MAGKGRWGWGWRGPRLGAHRELGDWRAPEGAYAERAAPWEFREALLRPAGLISPRVAPGNPAHTFLNTSGSESDSCVLSMGHQAPRGLGHGTRNCGAPITKFSGSLFLLPVGEGSGAWGLSQGLSVQTAWPKVEDVEETGERGGEGKAHGAAVPP